MSVDQTYANAKKAFEELEIGERTSSLELANRIGATIYEERKKVAAYLSAKAKRGHAKKHIGEDGRMYYEKIVPPTKPRATRPSPARVVPSKEIRRDLITYEEIAEEIVNYIDKLRARISELEIENEEFKRLYEEAEHKGKELSKDQLAAQRAVGLSKLLEE